MTSPARHHPPTSMRHRVRPPRPEIAAKNLPRPSLRPRRRRGRRHSISIAVAVAVGAVEVEVVAAAAEKGPRTGVPRAVGLAVAVAAYRGKNR
jgi:hypothetical protein